MVRVRIDLLGVTLLDVSTGADATHNDEDTGPGDVATDTERRGGRGTAWRHTERWEPDTDDHRTGFQERPTT